jgi:protein-L-isoaspartate(D-aspartate) O-methyltransferase
MPEPAAHPADRLVEWLQRRGISDPRVLSALRRVPRDRFVPESLASRAWDDDALPIGHGQTISQPYIVAWMTELLRLKGNESVLEVGTGSGYQTALLARLAAQVVTIERIAALSESARRLLDELGVTNVEYVIGDGTLGWPARAPYDGILVTAGAPDVPAPLYRQLKTGGRLVIPVGDSQMQWMQVVTKGPRGPQVERLEGCRFVPLIGEAGWEPHRPASSDETPSAAG